MSDWSATLRVRLTGHSNAGARLMSRPSARIAAALLVIGLLSGCIKEVVYVDGNGNVVGDPNRSPDINITNLSTSKSEPLTYVGNWSAPLNTLDRGGAWSARIST